jgi:Peptidase family M28
VPLDAKANIDIQQQLRSFKSHNVIGKLDGSELQDEYLIYTAHWDHLGRHSELQGDQISMARSITRRELRPLFSSQRHS